MKIAPRGVLFAAGYLIGVVTFVSDIHARPNIRSSFFSAYPSAVGSRLDNLPSFTGHCGVCHYDFAGGGTRNPYGARIEITLPNYPNTDAGRQQAIKSIQNLDSDTDGHSQLTEITDLVSFANTPTFPGLNSSNVGNITNVSYNDVLNYLTPSTGVDAQPPVVTLTAPNGGESWTGGTLHSITWIATDNVGVTNVDIFWRDAEAAPWTPLALSVTNSGSFAWFVPNMPTTVARVRVLARDAAGNTGTDDSAALFAVIRTPGGIVPTTLRDFHQPGTQPLGGGTFSDHAVCGACHAGYNPATEPGFAFSGSMMAQAARDPLFYACVAVADQDAPSAGDICLRCHTPFGWMSGRSTPTNGSGLIPSDRDGVACDYCHRVVDPIYKAGVSPTADSPILSALTEVPLNYANGQYVVDPNQQKRGPFADAVAPHAFLQSPVHRTADFCGTCHDVSNPVFNRVSGSDYAPGPLNQGATTFQSDQLLPLERTYSEWKNSAFPAGVYAPEFAGAKANGIVAICQDCHMSDVVGKGCNDPAAPTRTDLPFHDLTGGSSWMPTLVAAQYPSEVDVAALQAGSARSVALLQKSAVVDVNVAALGDSYQASVTVTNRCGHKLPTGYPEGRRMWLHVVAKDAGGNVIYESGAWDPATGILNHDPDITVYEIKLGLSPALAGAIGLPAGESFHFALNDTVYWDNRIPPAGFTNAAFDLFGGKPVDPTHAAPRYADGQNWDTQTYPLPPETRSVVATLRYQSTSKEYVEFLRDANTTSSAGQTMYTLWSNNGRAAPVTLTADSASIDVSGVEDQVPVAAVGLAPIANPFRDRLELRLDLAGPAAVRLEIFDLNGRRIAEKDYGTLGGGPQRLLWDGATVSGHDAGAGIYWARVKLPSKVLVTKVVKVR